MFKLILQRHGIWVLTYLLILLYLYTVGTRILISYFNIFLFFAAFILTKENLKNSNLNRDVILLFKYFYFYNSFVLLLIFGVYTLKNPAINLISFLYTDIGQSSMILMLSIYLFVQSLNIKTKNSKTLMLICAAIALTMTFINYYKFITTPESYYIAAMVELYVLKKYLFYLISIVLLLVFWIRYYNRYFVLSEYLGVIIFLFMLSNILDALHFIGYKHDLQFFGYGQYIFLTLNVFTVLFWYVRLEYLNTDLARENEKYLANYQLLEGLVNKPKQSKLQSFIVSISPNYFILFFVLLALGIFLLYAAKLVNLYLMINTIFVIITTLLAVFYSLSSIKRNWKNQFSFLFRNKNKEKV